MPEGPGQLTVSKVMEDTELRQAVPSAAFLPSQVELGEK